MPELKLLRAAADGTLPKSIGRDTAEFSFEILRELHEAGLMTATYFPAIVAAEQRFLDPRITHSGRQRLAELEQLAVPHHAGEPAEAPSDDDEEWFKKPPGIVALAVCAGVLVVFVVFLLRSHFGLAL